METGRGKSAYQSYRDTTNDNPILTEAQWVASLDGPAGPPGAPGAPGTNATPITAITDDGDGNLTISTSTTDYGPFALLGPAGPQGDPGSQGLQGDPGPAGAEATPITSITDIGDGNLVIYTASTNYGPFALKGPTGNDGPKGDAGETGGMGAKGDTGDTGPQGDIGYPGFKYDVRRVNANGVQYVPGEIIEYQGSYFICIATNDAAHPSDAAYWSPYSFVGPKGDQGDTGGQGPQGDPGQKGDTGNTGPGFYWLNAYIPGNGYVPGAVVKGSDNNLYVATGSGELGDPTSSGGWDLYLPKGTTGDAGPKGDTGDTGPMPYNYRGAWDGYANYSLYDAVTHQGSLYWLPATGGWTVGGAPPGYNWELLVSKGDTGATGTQGAKGDTGDTGPNTVTTSTTTDITGLLKGNGSVVSAATAGTDYAAAAHTHEGDTLGPVEKIQFDTTPAGLATTVGDLIWNVAEETLDLQLDGFTMHTGQHVIYHVQNNTGETIAKGTPVMFAGTTGNSGKLRIKPWDGIGPATLFMGITGEEFVQGHEGTVVAFGKVRGIQTDGDNYSQTWANGTIIYAGTNSVKLTSVKPSAPNPIVEVMAVVSAHANTGTVFVRPNYFTADVFGPSSVADNAIARFDGTTGKLIQTGGITIADNATGTLSGTNSGDVTLGGTPAYLTIENQVITRNQVSLAAASAHVTGTLPVANGGTGQTALSSIDAADFGSGNAADNYVLTADGSGGAAWEAASGGGGSSITGTGFAYVRTGGSATPTIGNPALPFPTGQAAWDAGATRFDFGPGSFSIDAAFGSGGYSLPVYFQGAGLSGSLLTLTWRGEDGVEQNGFTAPDLNLSSDKSITIQIAIEGGDATSAGSDTYNGGNIANHYFSNCYIQGLTLTAGSGCNGGTNGADASSSGAEFTNIVTGALQGSTIYKNAILEAGVFSPDKLSDGNKGSISVTTNGEAWSINENVIQFSNLTTASAKGKIIGRKTAGAGNFEECAITDFTHVTEHYMRTIDFFDSTGIVSNVTGLSCPVAENEKVLIEIVGFRVGGAAGSGLKISFSGPDSPTDVRYTLEHWNAVNTGRTVASATSFNQVLTQADGNTDSLLIRVTLTLINGPNAQTVQFRAGSEGSGTSITLPKGLTMRVHRIP